MTRRKRTAALRAADPTERPIATTVIVNENPRSTTATVTGAMDLIRADWDMSRQSRFIRRRTGVPSLGGSADYHYRVESQYYNDIEQARDLDRNDMIVGQTIDRARDNIVQDGFTLIPETGDKAVDDELFYRWKEFAESPGLCDIEGESCFHDYELAACRAMLADGDCLVLGTQDGPLQFIEAHEIQTKTRVDNVVLGVELSATRERTRYHIMQDSLNPLGMKTDSLPVDTYNDYQVRQAFQVYNTKRMSQTRGVTALAPIFSLAGMFEDINFAKLVQQQIVSCFAIFREQQGGSGNMPSVATGYGDSQVITSPSGVRQIEGVAPGMEITGKPGERLTGFSPAVPNAEFFTHVKLMLQIMGVNLGLPLCLVLMDGSETNFSGWRGAVDEARKGFKRNQRAIIKRFHKPVYEWKVSQWLESDPFLVNAFNRGVNLWGHRWNPPNWQYIEPEADARGDVLRIQNCLTSLRRLHAERGNDWQVIADEQIDDTAYAIVKAKAKAQEINNRFKDNSPVHWRDLIGLPLTQGITASMQDPNAVAVQAKQAEANKGAEANAK